MREVRPGIGPDPDYNRSLMPDDTARQRYDELASQVEHGDGRWLVLTHDNPDPDALAGALVLGRLLRDGFGQKATLAHGGLIGRAENRAMVKSLDLRISHLRHLTPRHYSRYALVDAQPGTGNSRLPEGAEAELVFDHHPARRMTSRVPFADVRPEYGATASLLAEYLLASGLPVTKAEATAVVYAIRVETQDFSREYGARDKEIYDLLLPRVDKRALGKIQNARLPVSYFGNLHQALENLETIDNLVVSHLAEVAQPDIVPELADLLVRMEGKTWSFATGRYGDRVYLSIRTTNPRARAGEIMRKLVGRNGKGGGHEMTAGGWVAITSGYADDPRALQEQLARRLAKYLKKNPDRLTPVDFSAG